MNQGIVQPGLTPLPLRRFGTPLFVQRLLTSRTIVAPGPGWLEFVVMGAGGSGALSLQGNVDTRAQGGAAGGTAFKRVRVNGGEVFTLTLGAGGTARSSSGVTTLNGNQGGTTTLVGPGVNVVIPGGLGGTALANVTTTIEPQARSLPVGGDINLPGGVAGGINIGTLDTNGKATGGAGPRLGIQLPDSGSITAHAVDGAATGGAGIFPSGSLSGGSRVTGGGGATEPSLDNSSAQGATLGAFGYTGNVAPNAFWGTWILAIGGTAGSNSNTTPPTAVDVNSWGGGSGGWSVGNSANAGTGGNATFGGTGGVATNNAAHNLGAGNATYVAGGGGAAITDATAGTSWNSGAGGSAIAFVAFFPETF